MNFKLQFLLKHIRIIIEYNKSKNIIMANQFSFDIISEVDLQEVDNAINQATKEIQQRYDFKGSKSEITLNKRKTL